MHKMWICSYDEMPDDYRLMLNREIIEHIEKIGCSTYECEPELPARTAQWCLYGKAALDQWAIDNVVVVIWFHGDQEPTVKFYPTAAFY